MEKSTLVSTKKRKAQELFDKLERNRITQCKALAHLPIERWDKNPPQGGWSATQVVQHLYLAEYGSWRYVQKQVSQGQQLEQASLQSHWNSLKLNLFLASPLKFKAPEKVSTAAMPSEQSASEAWASWENLRAQIKREMSDFKDEHFAVLLYRHPRAGALTLAAMLRFFQVHQQRHFKQIKRTLSEVISP